MRTKTTSEYGIKPILDTDWRTLMVSPEWERQMAAAVRTVDTRVAVLDTIGTELADALADAATVIMAGGGTEMWACTIAGTDPDWLPVDENDLLDPLSGNRVRVFWQEWLPELDAWGEIPVCTGWPHDPETEDDGAPAWTLTVRDTLAEVKRTGYGDTTLDVGGLTVDAALALLFSTVAPLLPYRFPASTVTLPTPYTLGENTVDEDWIAALAGWEVWTDREGTITASPITATKTVAWQEGSTSRVTSLKRRRTTSTIYNRVVVESSSSAVVPSVSGSAQDEDPSSPTFAGTYGPFTIKVKSDLVTTEAECDALAKVLLAQYLFPVELVTGTSVPRPDLGYGDGVVLGRESIGVFGTHTLAMFTLRMPGGGKAPEAMDLTMSPRSLSR